MSKTISTTPSWDITELDDDPRRYRHKMYALDKARSLETGMRIMALCGFVGTVRNKKAVKPLCPACQVKASFMVAGGGR